jgi:hypothetical protein
VTWYPVARVGDIGSGDVLSVSVDGKEMILGLDGERYFAMQRRVSTAAVDTSSVGHDHRHRLNNPHGMAAPRKGRHKDSQPQEPVATSYNVPHRGPQQYNRMNSPCDR